MNNCIAIHGVSAQFVCLNWHLRCLSYSSNQQIWEILITCESYTIANTSAVKTEATSQQTERFWLFSFDGRQKIRFLLPQIIPPPPPPQHFILSTNMPRIFVHCCHRHSARWKPVSFNICRSDPCRKGAMEVAHVSVVLYWHVKQSFIPCAFLFWHLAAK